MCSDAGHAGAREGSRIGEVHPIHGALAFLRVFDLPLGKATRLANWEGVQTPGLTADEIEEEVGEYSR